MLVEAALANLHKKNSSLLFTSGYIANQATIIALGKILPHCVFLSDEENHASIITGIRGRVEEPPKMLILSLSVPKILF